MISINSRGDFCHGVGGNYFNINNVQIRPGGSGGWITDDTAAFADGTDGWKVAVYDVTTGTAKRGHPEYPDGVVTTDIKAGGGVYASWPGVGGVLASTGFFAKDGGLLGVGPDGAIAYKPSYQSNGPSMVRELDGSEWMLTPNHPYDLQLLGQGRALWNDTVMGFSVRGVPKPQFLPGAAWFPTMFMLEGKWWVGYQGAAGSVAHPYDSFIGYQLTPPGQDAWIAFRALSDRLLRFVWSVSIAEQAGQLIPRTIDVAVEPRVDLTTLIPPAHVDVPPPHTDTPPPHSDIPHHDHHDTPHMDTPPPLPPIKDTQRYWLHPNIDSDVVAACTGDLATVDVFGLFVQWILEDERYSKLVSADALYAIRKQGVNLEIEMGSLKPGDYHGEQAQASLRTVSERVLLEGHMVGYLTMDEPLTATYQAYDGQGNLIWLDTPVQPLEESAFAIAKFVQKARETMPGVRVGWAEAWPQIDLEQMRKCLMILDSWGCHLDYWHLDIDWKRASEKHLDPHKMIQEAKKIADDYRTPLGVYLAGYSHSTDTEYYNEVVAMAADIHSHESFAIDHVLVESWAARTGTNKQDLPANFGDRGLFPLFGHIQENIFV